MRKFVLFLLIVFNSCTYQNDTIKIKGSDTEVNLAVTLAEAFHKQNSHPLVSISGGGSGFGIASLLNGNADIANSSRSIKQSELKLFVDKNIALDSFVFAQDAIAFVVSEKIKLDSINTTTIAKILSGEIDNWQSVTNQQSKITIYGRQSNSGTYDFVKAILNIKFSPLAKQMNGNAQIIEAVKNDASGIGYVSAGYVLNGNANGLKILKVYHQNSKAYSPLDAQAITDGLYYFQRPLLQYYRKNNFLKIQPIILFEQSSIGANIIKQSGYYPAKN